MARAGDCAPDPGRARKPSKPTARRAHPARRRRTCGAGAAAARRARARGPRAVPLSGSTARWRAAARRTRKHAERLAHARADQHEARAVHRGVVTL